MNDEAIRGEVRQAGFRRVSHGLYLPDRPQPTSDDEVSRELHALRLVLPTNAAFTHVTAAWLMRWWLPQLPTYAPFFASVDLNASRPRRAGLVCSRIDDRPEPVLVRGLPVDDAVEVLLRAARDLALLDLVPLVDSALRSPHVDMRRLRDVCGGHRPGVRALRRALDLADPRSESAWESLLRLFHVLADIPVESQFVVRGADGLVVARGDLHVLGTPYLHEYDGAHHRTTGQQSDDLRRARRLLETPYIRRGFSRGDLLERALPTLREIDLALGRPHRPDRLARWRREVSQSCLSNLGRRRLANRWLKQSDPIHWSRTA